MCSQPSFLIAIPAYQESNRLPRFLAELAAVMQKEYPRARIVVVDDGSGQEEQRAVGNAIAELQKEFSCILNPVLLAENRGKGGAILAAWDQGEVFDYLAFVDADGAVTAKEVSRLAGMLPMNPDNPALFSSRIRMMGRIISRTWKRHLSGRIFAFIVGYLIQPSVYDSQCGLKFLPLACYQKIRPMIQGRGFAFDVELLAALKTIGWPVVEVPIDWIDIPGSKVTIIRDTFKMLISVMEIKHNIKNGHR